jgi:hypothetical protein
MQGSIISMPLVASALTLASACGDLTLPVARDASVDPGTDADSGADDAGAVPVGGPHVVHSRDADGFRAAIDASNTAAVVYLDLDTGAELVVADAGSDTRWDLAFKRSEVRANGGVSGSAGVGAVILASTSYESVVAAPSAGYVSDAPDGADADTTPDLVVGGWYDYNMATHVLGPADRTYVVRTSEGAYVKIRFTGYYDGAGTSGHPAFRWRVIPAD